LITYLSVVKAAFLPGIEHEGQTRELSHMQRSAASLRDLGEAEEFDEVPATGFVSFYDLNIIDYSAFTIS
jgi:hypothetical protein